tara:strand:- start:842 stop:1009 length:168 start_codon:yes stop_codon:yes gene_type:complete
MACNKKDLPDLSVPVITNSDSVDSCSDLERLRSVAGYVNDKNYQTLDIDQLQKGK